jgi:hypothetical protein
MRMALEQVFMTLPADAKLTILPTASATDGLMLNASTVAQFGGWARVKALLLPDTLLAREAETNFAATFAAVENQVRFFLFFLMETQKTIFLFSLMETQKPIFLFFLTGIERPKIIANFQLNYFTAPAILLMTASSPATATTSSSLATVVASRRLPLFVVGFASGLRNVFGALTRFGGGAFSVHERPEGPLATASALADVATRAVAAATGRNLQSVANLVFDSPQSRFVRLTGHFDLPDGLVTDQHDRANFHLFFMVEHDFREALLISPLFHGRA